MNFYHQISLYIPSNLLADSAYKETINLGVKCGPQIELGDEIPVESTARTVDCVKEDGTPGQLLLVTCQVRLY